MTQDQWLMMVRMLLQMGGIVLMSKGVFTDADWNTLSTDLMAFAGAGFTLWGVVWTFWTRRSSGLKSTVANMPNTVVVTSKSPEILATVASTIAEVPGVQTVKAPAIIANAVPSLKVVP
jgi:hypothetical protein